MAWRLSGDKPLSEPMMHSTWRIYASLGLNELTPISEGIDRWGYGIGIVQNKYIIMFPQNNYLGKWFKNVENNGS